MTWSGWARTMSDTARRKIQLRRNACGGVFTAVCTRGNHELLVRLLDAASGCRRAHGCRGYLLENLELFRILLAHGMSPDLPDWQGQTLLHGLCRGGERGQAGDALARAASLLDAGASISAREDEYCSTPLAWAARTNMPDMVEFLLGRGAPAHLPDDGRGPRLSRGPWRGHEVAGILWKHGATR
jgi:hypothetical protein